MIEKLSRLATRKARIRYPPLFDKSVLPANDVNMRIHIAVIAAVLVGFAWWLCRLCLVRSSVCTSDAAQIADLRHLREGIRLFHEDNGRYPVKLTELATMPGPRNLQGPYIDGVMNDPISWKPFRYDPVRHSVRSSAVGNDAEGIPYTAR